MRGVSRWARRVAPLLAVFVVFGVSAAWADDPPAPTDPPQARLNPPVGVAAQARVAPPVGVTPAMRPGRVMPQARLNPPVGTPTPDPEPEGEEPLLASWLTWLQSRISIPNG